MPYYGELNPISHEVLAKIMGNTNLQKLLKFNPTDAGNLINENILYSAPKLSDADTKQNCLLAFFFDGETVYNKDPNFKRVKLIFQIICHLDFWYVDNNGNDVFPDREHALSANVRVYSIMNELDKMFNNKSITFFDDNNVSIENVSNSSTINKLIPNSFTMNDFSYKYYGIIMSYTIQLPGVGCES